jgi:hypothetical protein
MELWIGPVIVAALVSGLVNAAGWFVTFRQSVRLEQMRRHEKVHDFQVALRAEIDSDRLNMVVVDWQAYRSEIVARYAADPDFSVVVPHMASNPIFSAVAREIHILPGDVIAPVVNYARLRETIERFVLDLRADSFRRLPADRQLLMYSDYLDMLSRLERLAEHAVAAIDNSLGTSNPDVDRSNQVSASAPGAGQVGAVERNEP